VTPGPEYDTTIAIVGMAARVPGARTPAQFWDNLANGVESVTTLTEEQLLEAGVRREAILRPGYVRSAAVLDHMEWFDAEFFGFSPKDAAIMDPQHRQFLEVCWEALEDAAHPPSTFDGAVGVFGGCGMGAYFAFNLLSNPDLVDDVGMFLLRHTGNDKDFLVTRASYLLDLQGPAVNVQTACSTSLVATHLAVQHLLSGECDMALAGGVTIEIPHGRGYQYEPGEILSPDGHCRAFDHRAAGTVFGSGAGVVVLRRLADALADGDHIYALVRGTAVNNDGARKVGYLAPSVDGQAACIAEALAVADVAPSSVQYVECHGTGTAMGDPIEVTALTHAFPAAADGTPYCRIGSVKTNIGHLDTAAGVASLIKASLALQHQAMPPSINFEAPNPNLPLAGSAFQVNDSLHPWAAPTSGPRRAGVNSLGVGGTNAFAVLEEAPGAAPSTPTSGPQLLALSARNRAALDGACRALAQHLRGNPQLNLADVAFTLHRGRHAFGARRVLSAASVEEAAELLDQLDPRQVFTHTAGTSAPPVVFLLPGGGAQYPRMAAELYAEHVLFRELVDHGLQLAEQHHGLQLRPLLFPEHADAVQHAEAELQHASLQLPTLLIVEHALARLLISWGVQPSALLGHSVGENVAACLAGTIDFADCLALVALRGRLMDATRGGMVAVALTPDELQPLLDECRLDLAAVNAPDLCVASGSDEALEGLAARAGALGIEAHRVRIHIAAHSRLLDPVLDEFRSFLRTLRLHPPQIPWVSNRTGTWVTPEQAVDPEYWVGQLRNTVQFSAGVATVATQHPNAVFVEVGPGKTLSSLARLNRAFTGTHAAVHTVRHPDETVADTHVLLTALGRLWATGGEFPVERAYTSGTRNRLSLPTYSFQSQRYFIEPGQRTATASDELPLLDRLPTDQWFSEPVWRPSPVLEQVGEPVTVLLFADQLGIADRVGAGLRQLGHDVVTVRMGDSYCMVSPTEYQLAAEHGRPAYEQLVADLVRQGTVPDRVLNLALLAEREEFRPGLSFFHRNQELGFYNLVFFMQAWAAEGLRRPLHLVVATANAQRATATDRVTWPEQATVLGPVLVLPHELPDVSAVALDVQLPEPPTGRRGRRRGTPHVDLAPLVSALLDEATAAASSGVFAWRPSGRFQRAHRRAAEQPQPFPLRQHAVVLVTGGLGGIGLTLARRLHERVAAKLILLSREPLPPEDQWQHLRDTLGLDHPVVQRIDGVQALIADGAEVTVMEGDVTNIAHMRRIVASIRSTLGSLDGVVHAAGVTDDAALLQKQQIDIERVLAAKVYGTLVLHEVTADQPLQLFALCSSTSTVTGPPGQIDYVAANAFLNSFADAHGPSVRAIGWGAWSDVGMAVEAVRRLFDDGAQRPSACTGPFFATVRTDVRGVSELDTVLDEGHWFIDEHRTAAGDALLPGAATVEIVRQALCEVGEHRPFEISDLVLLAPLPVAAGTTVPVRAVLTPTDHGFAFELRAELPLPTKRLGESAAPSTNWVRTAQAQVLLRAVPPAAPSNLDQLLATCPARGALRSRQHDHLRFGPRWNVATRVHTGDGRAVAELSVPATFIDDLHRYPLHPALLDIGLCFAVDLVPGYTGDRLWVPVSAQSVVVHSPTGPPDQLADVVVVADVSPGSSEASGFATFDISFLDRQGTTLIRVDGFTMKRLDGPLDLDQRDTMAVDTAAPTRQVTRAETRCSDTTSSRASPLRKAPMRS
jgi:acyl transferase domain-containing protein